MTTSSAWRLKIMMIGSAATTALVGCQAPEPRETWTPQPRIEWNRIAAEPVPPIENRYLLLESGPSRGRFPCSMAVSRVTHWEPELNYWVEPEDETRLAVPATPHNEFLIWNSTFDDLFAVSEVFPVVQKDLGGYPPDARLIVAAGHNLGAGLSLLYTVNQPTPDHVEMMGVLHDGATTRPIAAIHVDMKSHPRPEDAREAPNNVDAWKYEARSLARERFSELMVRCLRELIDRDTPIKVDVPEGWRSQGVSSLSGLPPDESPGEDSSSDER